MTDGYSSENVIEGDCWQELTAGVVEQLRTRSFYDRAEEIQAQNEEGDVLKWDIRLRLRLE